MEILYYLQDEPRNLGLICNSSEIQLVFPGKKHLAFHFELQRELLSRSSWPRSQIHADLNSLNHKNRRARKRVQKQVSNLVHLHTVGTRLILDRLLLRQNCLSIQRQTQDNLLIFDRLFLRYKDTKQEQDSPYENPFLSSFWQIHFSLYKRVLNAVILV